jgi:hypothetical protein
MNAAPMGMTTRNTIVVPCIVKTWLYRSADSTWPFGVASWARMSSASMPPMTKNTMAAVPYMMPSFLWSTVVTQLRQPVEVRGRVKTPMGLAVPRPFPEGRARGPVSVSAIESSRYFKVLR